MSDSPLHPEVHVSCIFLDASVIRMSKATFFASKSSSILTRGKDPGRHLTVRVIAKQQVASSCSSDRAWGA